MRRGLMIIITAVAVVLWSAGVASAATRWAIQPTPNPAPEYDDNALNSVSCTSPASCTAVGWYDTPAGELTLAEYWDGSTWAVQATPNPAGATQSYLNGVSCTSSASCTAVGSTYSGSGAELTLAEYWDGSTWAIQATQNLAGADVSTLASVSCPSSASCTAVGHSCPKPNCGQPDRPLAEHWDGSTWKIQATPVPVGSTGTDLYGVSCHPAYSCTAAGTYSNSSGTVLTLAEHWDGSTWAIQATPNPTGATDSRLNGISCHSPTSCTATGEYYNSGSPAALTLAEHWDGSTWAIQATPNPAFSIDSYLNGVSCASDASCTAVGSFEKPNAHDFPVAEYWNGSTWMIQVTPSPIRDSLNLSLAGVWCTSPGTCTAVGHYLSSAGELTLAEAK